MTWNDRASFRLVFRLYASDDLKISFVLCTITNLGSKHESHQGSAVRGSSGAQRKAKNAWNGWLDERDLAPGEVPYAASTAYIY